MKTMILTAIIAALVSGCWEERSDTQERSSQNQPRPPAEQTVPSTDGAGERIASRCGDCHGNGGASETRPVPHLAGQRLEYLVRELKAYGEGARDNAAMHAVVKSLSDDEVWSAAAYFAMHGDENAVSKPDAGAWPNLYFTKSVGKWVQKCNRCHDDNGFADHGRFPILTGQRKEYLADSMRAYQSKFLRNSSMMHAMTELLSIKDIDDIATYYALRPGKERVGSLATRRAETNKRSQD